MSVESELYARLKAVSGVADLVGTRVYYGDPPQSPTYPLVSFFRVSTEPREGSMGTDDGIVRARFQFEAWAETHQADARALVEAVRAAIQRYGVGGAGTAIQDVYLQEDEDDPPPVGSEPRLWRSRLDATVVYTE